MIASRRMGAWSALALGWILVSGPAGAQLVVNEVMPAPGTDWNDDGGFSSSEDEWVELMNVGVAPLSVDGFFLTDASDTPRFGLAGALAPGEHLFITGEQAADWSVANGYPAVGLSLNNSGDSVILFEAAGGATTEVARFDWSGSNPDVSWGRLPDGTGAFEEADALTPGGTGVQPTPGSPNGGPAGPKILAWDVSPAFPTDADPIRISATCGDTDGVSSVLLRWTVDGASQPDESMLLASGTDALGTWEFTVPAQPAGAVVTAHVFISDGSLFAATNDRDISVAASGSSVVLNEVLADPPPDAAGDANGDGTRSTTQDEFVELVNVGSSAVDLGGWSLFDATGERHVFATGVTIPANGFHVVFGGGTPTGIPSGAEVASSGGLSLNNTSDEVRLVDAAGVTRDFHAYGSEANRDESLIRVPDGGPWTTPSDAGYGWAFSPGATNTGPSAVEPESWAAVKSLYRP